MKNGGNGGRRPEEDGDGRFVVRNAPAGSLVARVTLVVLARSLAFSVVRCVECGRVVMDVPGWPEIELRPEKNRNGRGRLVTCRRCHAKTEVVEHGRPLLDHIPGRLELDAS